MRARILLALTSQKLQARNIPQKMQCYSCGFPTGDLGDTVKSQIKEIIEKKSSINLTPDLWAQISRVLFRKNSSGPMLCLACTDKFCTMSPRKKPVRYSVGEGAAFRVPNFVCATCNILNINVPLKDPVRLSFRKYGRDCIACFAFQELKYKNIAEFCKLVNPNVGYIKDMVVPRVVSTGCKLAGCGDNICCYDFSARKGLCYTHFSALYPHLSLPDQYSPPMQAQQNPDPPLQLPEDLAILTTACEVSDFSYINLIPNEEPADIFNPLPMLIHLEDVTEELRPFLFDGLF